MRGIDRRNAGHDVLPVDDIDVLPLNDLGKHRRELRKQPLTLHVVAQVGDVGSGEAHFLTDLRVIHPVLAIVAASVGWWVSGRVGMPRSKAGRSLPILVGLMLLSGALNVALGVPVWMQLVHLFLADALWIAYVLTAAQALQVPAEVGQPV